MAKYSGQRQLHEGGGCGGLNRNGPHRLMSLNAGPMESGTISRCGHVGGNASLRGWAWWSPMLKPLQCGTQTPSAACG